MSIQRGTAGTLTDKKKMSKGMKTWNHGNVLVNTMHFTSVSFLPLTINALPKRSEGSMTLNVIEWLNVAGSLIHLSLVKSSVKGPSVVCGGRYCAPSWEMRELDSCVLAVIKKPLLSWSSNTNLCTHPVWAVGGWMCWSVCPPPPPWQLGLMLLQFITLTYSCLRTHWW